jgi:UDP-N-acetylglucosamine 1-carboxyvinyltransferase
LRLTVQGRPTLKGTYTPSGSSNEAISLIVAALLGSETTLLQGVPGSAVVRMMAELAGELGAAPEWQGSELRLNPSRMGSRFANEQVQERSMAAVLMLAPILAHREHAQFTWTEPLGRLHTHLAALRDLGVKIDIDGQTLSFHAHRWEKREIVLIETSVTATALVCMMAAVMGEETRLWNAASEPHLRALQEILVQMGARIDGIGSNLLHIYGCADGLKGATQAIQPDHIEAASIALLSALRPGYVTIDPVNARDLQIISRVYERLGINLIFEDNRLHVPEQGDLIISRREEDVDVAIDTAPWPGFPSDLLAMVAVAATQTYGTTLLHEKLFNNRLLFVDKLKGMGAQIVLADPHRAVVIGPTPLRGEYIDTPDVRIGLALLGAALAAEGSSVIDRAELIERNFEGVIQKLVSLGADIQIS